jgi:signal transduction histidine kinase
LFRLRKAEVELIKKSETLRKTNQRLSNACKSAGLGAISAHLMHAIKSPLMGLKNLDFGGDQKDKETATKMLKATTQKIESLIHDTLNSLREHELDEESYTFEIHELLSITSNKFSHLSKNNRVNILSSPHDSCKLDNLKANLLLPILENLVQNGLDASPDSKVFLQVEKKDDSFLFNVMDNGPGVPEVLKDKLFSPMQSNKKNGSGIGLAICKELAEQINAKITLKSSTDKGSTFCIQFIVKG